MSESQEAFDLESVYDAEIQPLMEKILAICKEHKLPVFATFLYANDPNGDADYCTTNLMPEEWNRPIPDKMLRLLDLVYTKRSSALRLTVKNADGIAIEEIVIL